MCGIVGYVTSDGSVDWEDRLRRAADALAHRGPDDRGEFSARGPFGQVGLAHRRLSIVDLSEAGRQPFISEDGAIALVCNGEIYNAAELRDRLIAAGHRFRSRSDSEVILHGFEEWGADVVTRLRGMFAFALWDSRRRRLWLMRDRLGIKPLLYALLPHGVVFASELNVLADWPEVGRRLCRRAVGQYLTFGHTLTPLTVLESVRKLRPGHTLRYDAGDGRVAESCYWRLADAFHNAMATPPRVEAAEGELWRRLGDAVTGHAAADVPVGAFLSGGVDSAAVSALLRRDAAELTTFCAGFDVADYSEADHAARAAQSIGARHERFDVACPLPDDMPALVRSADEPTADSSFVACSQLCAFARRRVKVVLSGDGADELLAGYATYRADEYHRHVRRLPIGARRWAAGALAPALKPSATKVGLAFKARQFLAAAGDDARRAHAQWRRLWRAHELDVILPSDPHADPVEDMCAHFDAVDGLPFLQQAMYVDLSTWLPDGILHKVDRASMACGLEVRVPFLDDHFVEWCAALPPELKLRGGTGKYILRRAVRRFRPELAHQTRKQGFNSPVGHWLTGRLSPWVDDVLSYARRHARDWLTLDGPIADHLTEHRAGVADHGFKLWGLLWLIEWCRVNRTIR